MPDNHYLASADDTPKVAQLKAILQALNIVEAELGFQLMRLTEHVTPRTDEERKYHEELKEGYESSRYFVRLLRKYHDRRLTRMVDGGPSDEVDVQDGIDSRGAASAYIDDTPEP